MNRTCKRFYWRFPSSSSRRYTQVSPSQIFRHFGRDAEIQAMDGNQSVALVLD